MANPYFIFKQFTIRQDRATLKVTTDACLLGAYAKAVAPKNILDIGTGTGILAIMLAQRFPGSRIEAVESDQEAADQARINAEDSPWGKRIRIITSRIQDFIRIPRTKYDLIICNPPYHESQLVSKDPKFNLARHSVDLTLHVLAFIVNQLITEEGWFWVIVPPGPFQVLVKEMAPYGIQCIERLSIFNRPEKPIYRIIAGFTRGSEKLEESSLLIANVNNKYTSEFRELLKDFYLAF
jgi:tRNA1Val (adenine37-N6)-methyltransferase